MKTDPVNAREIGKRIIAKLNDSILDTNGSVMSVTASSNPFDDFQDGTVLRFPTMTFPSALSLSSSQGPQIVEGVPVVAKSLASSNPFDSFP